MSVIFSNIKCPGCKEDLGISLIELFFVPEWECPHCQNIIKLTMDNQEESN